MELNRKRENSDREANLKTLVRSIMDKEIGKRRDTQDLKDDLASLTSMARDLQEAQQSLEEDDLRNFSQCLSNLRNREKRRTAYLKRRIHKPQHLKADLTLHGL